MFVFVIVMVRVVVLAIPGIFKLNSWSYCHSSLYHRFRDFDKIKIPSKLEVAPLYAKC